MEMPYPCSGFPFLGSVLLSAPDWFTKCMTLETQGFVDLHDKISNQIDEILSDPQALEKRITKSSITIYWHWKGLLSRLEKKLLEKPQSYLLLGDSGRSWVGVFHLLNSNVVHNKLVQELQEAWPNQNSVMGYEALQKLSYLDHTQ